MASKTELKHAAQDQLMVGLRAAFSMMEDSRDEALCDEMSRQMARIEKLFGLVEFSTPRGI